MLPVSFLFECNFHRSPHIVNRDSSDAGRGRVLRYVVDAIPIAVKAIHLVNHYLRGRCRFLVLNLIRKKAPEVAAAQHANGEYTGCGCNVDRRSVVSQYKAGMGNDRH